MALTLNQALLDLFVQTCALMVVLVAGLIVFVALARQLASGAWWRGWGKPDD
jgi:hypothetical protein